MDFVVEAELLLRTLGAMAIGTVLGLERELAEKPAGMRTHMLLAGAACLLVLLGDVVVSEFYSEETRGVIRADPIRIFEAIVVGVSFIGTGTIWQSRRENRIEGLTTAASLLFAASLGVTVALERFLLALVLAVLVLSIGRGLRWVEDRLLRR